MQLLRSIDFRPRPDDRVFCEGVVGRIVVALVFLAISALWLAVPAVAGPWGYAAWTLGLPLFGLSLVALRGALRGLGGQTWVVRARPDGILLHLRSYLNGPASEAERVIAWIPREEIRRIRACTRSLRLPEDRREDVVWRERHLELELVHANTGELERALALERRPRRRGRAHFGAHAVSLPRPDLVRVAWRGPTIALRPGLERAREHLAERFPTEPLGAVVDVNWRHLDEAGIDALVRELCLRGSRIEAMQLLAVRRGWPWKRAKEFVDELTGRSNDSQAA
jgi:hypothetical protein